MLKILGLLVIFLNLADNYTTAKFLNATSGEYVVVEGNPVVGFFMDTVGIKASLGLEMAALTFMVLFLSTSNRLRWKARFWTLVFLAVLPLWAVTNNVLIARSFRIPLF